MDTSSSPDLPVRLGREVIYESSWVSLYADKVRLPAGQIIDRFHVLEFAQQAVSSVVENEQGQILLVECYRYVSDSVEWEVPGGLIDAGEDILAAAQREVLEETGYQTRDPQHLYAFNPENGLSNRLFHVAHCTAHGEPAVFDGNEIRGVHWRSVDEVRQMISDRQIHDGYSLTALLLFLMNK